MKYNNGTEDIEIVKRIAAAKGDTITIDNGSLYINGNLIEGLYMQQHRKYNIYLRRRPDLCSWR